MSRQQPASASGGFTLIELMIVVAIIAVLVAIAYPSYVAYIMRTNRAAAQACLSQYANWMERYYTTNLRYDQDASSTANPILGTAPSGTATVTLECATKTGSRYTYTATASTTPSATYTLTAVPTGAQVSDTQCGTLTLNQAGAKTANGTLDTTGVCWKN